MFFSLYASILLLIFEQGHKQNIGPGFFKICKYTFLKFGKGDKQTLGPDFF